MLTREPRKAIRAAQLAVIQGFSNGQENRAVLALAGLGTAGTSALPSASAGINSCSFQTVPAVTLGRADRANLSLPLCSQ